METEESKFELDMHICPKIYRAVYASNFVESNEDFWLGEKKKIVPTLREMNPMKIRSNLKN